VKVLRLHQLLATAVVTTVFPHARRLKDLSLTRGFHETTQLRPFADNHVGYRKPCISTRGLRGYLHVMKQRFYGELAYVGTYERFLGIWKRIPISLPELAFDSSI
jgi:hypothetical protein